MKIKIHTSNYSLPFSSHQFRSHLKTTVMKNSFLKFSIVILFVATLQFSCSSASSLVSTLASNPNLSGITSLLKGAGGIDKLLGGNGPFTLLAPSNDALSSLGTGAVENLLKPENQSQLTNMLKGYVLPGKMDATALTGASGAKNALGNSLNLGDAKITQSIPVKNGVVQVIDKLLP